MTVSDRTRESALKALDGMEEVVQAEMLVHGVYATEVIDEKLAEKGAICGGRQYCAIGALWTGAGIRVEPYGRDRLPGVYPAERRDFLARRPGLRLAYETLNEVAQAWVVRNRRKDQFCDDDESLAEVTIEDVFEHDYEDRREIGRGDMLRFIRQARERILA
jgi:hypothetical protein